MGRKCIGVYVADCNHWSFPFYLGASAAARDRDCNLICYINPSWAGENQLDGILTLLPTSGLFLQRIEPLQKRGVPVMAITDGVESFSSVCADNRGGIEQAVTHLAKHGHRRILFLRHLGDDHLGELSRRCQGYSDGLSINGLEPDPALVLPVEHMNVESVRQRVAKLIHSGPEFTAVLGITDWAAMGAIEALRLAGKRVPEDVAVIGFDNFDYRTRRFDPPLASITMPSYEVGYAAVCSLLEKVESGDRKITREMVPMRLLTRRSCGCDQRGTAPAGVQDDSLWALARHLFARARDIAPQDNHRIAAQFVDGCREGLDLLKLLPVLFRQATACGMDPIWCHNFSVTFREHLARCQSQEGAPMDRDQVLQQLHLHAIRWSSQYDVYIERLRSDFYATFEELRQQAAQLPDEPTIINCIRRCAQRAGMKFFMLLLPSISGAPESDIWEWRAEEGDGIRRRKLRSTDSSSARLLPDDDHRYVAIQFDLFKNDQDAWAVIHLDMESPYLWWYPELVHYIANALSSSRFHIALQTRTKELEVTRSLLEVAVFERKKAMSRLQSLEEQVNALQQDVDGQRKPNQTV